MSKYILELTQEQAEAVSAACDLYSRIKLGQFNRIVDHTLEPQLPNMDMNEFCIRREKMEEYLLKARQTCYPDLLNTFGHSYGLGNDKSCTDAWNVYQALRYELNKDQRKPFEIWGKLPKCEVVKTNNRNEEEPMCSTCDYRKFETVIVNGTQKLQSSLGVGKMVIRCDPNGRNWKFGVKDDTKDEFTLYACPTCQRKLR